MHGIRLDERPIHLGLGATAQTEPPFGGGMAWYEAYVARHAADGVDGRLVSLHRFTTSWDVWEVHPHGAEVVLCTEGVMTLIQEDAGGLLRRTVLGVGAYAINEAGVWHTADVDGAASAVFITAGVGTQHRPR